MTKEQLNEIKEVIRESNLSPVQRMRCFVCDYCDVYKTVPIRAHCRLHNYDLMDAHDGVCFQFRPLRNK